MSERWRGLRWVFLGASVLMLVVFVLAQRQSVDVSYARSPSGNNAVEEGSADELTDAVLPSVAEMTDMVAKERSCGCPARSRTGTNSASRRPSAAPTCGSWSRRLV